MSQFIARVIPSSSRSRTGERLSATLRRSGAALCSLLAARALAA